MFNVRDLLSAPLTGYFTVIHLDLILRNAKVQAHDSVLCMGSGNGFESIMISKIAGSVVGVDISEPMICRLNMAPKPSNLTFIQADLTKPLSRGLWGKFDRCVSIDVLEYVGDKTAFLKYAYSSLKNGGLFVATFPIENESHGRNFLGQSEVYELFNKSKFESVKIKYFRQDFMGRLISKLFTKAQNLLNPTKETDEFHQTRCFEMMQNPGRIQKILKIPIILLYLLSADSYSEKTEGKRCLAICRKKDADQ